MLHFIIGKVGAGKTTALHKLIAKRVKEENAQVILIVPKQFTFDTDSSVLDILGPKDACNVQVLSFSRLADTVLKTCRGIKKPPLSDGANAIIMSLALESLQEKLEFFSKHSGNISFVKKILSEIKSFKQSAVLPEELLAASVKLPDGILKKKLQETALIYETYNALVETSFYDDGDLLTIIYEILKDSRFFENKIVALDDFSNFSVQELKIISLMLKEAEDVYVTACCDSIFSVPLSSPFARSVTTVNRLRTLAAKEGVAVSSPVIITDEGEGFSTYSHKALYHLENNLYKSDYSVFKEDCDCITLCAAATAADECNTVACEIKRLLREGRYRCRDIAVVYRNAQPYEKEIRFSLKKYGVPVFEDRRQPIENEPLVVFVRALLEICAQGFSDESVLRLMKTGLMGVTAEETADVENYALMWSINGKDWLKEWKDDPEGFGTEMTDEKREELKRINEIRNKVTSAVSFFAEKIKTANGKESMTLLYRFLTDNCVNDHLRDYALFLEESGNLDLAKEQEQVWDLVIEAIDKIACVLDEKTISPKRLCEVFELIISTMSLGKLPDGFDEVYICGCDRIATIMPKVIFVVGANSGVFPQTVSSTGIFGEFEKERLKEDFPDLFDSVKKDIMAERFMVYNSLCSAREKLYVSWAQTGSSGEKISESEIVTDLRKLFLKIKTVNTAMRSAEEKIEGEIPAFELAVKLWNEKTPVSQSLKEYFLSKPEYEGKIKAIERATEIKPFEIKNPQRAKELFGKNIYLSATRLEDYSLCPFKYFCRHELKAKPRKIAKLDPAQSGTLVHFVLENLLSEHKGKNFLSVSKEELDKEMQSLLLKYVETYMGGLKEKSSRFEYLYLRTLKILRVIVSRLLCEFENSDFEPCDFELKVGSDGKIKPFRVALEEGYIELGGIIDRVDKMDLEGKRYIRVVDYKTGKKEFALSDVLGGLNMQMLLYLVSIWRNGKEYYGENIVPAGVLYLPAKFDAYSVSRDDSEEQKEKKRLSAGKMNGMILDSEEVIKGMDNDLSGTVIPIRVNRSGSISGNFISLAQLGRLAGKMDEIMAQMGNELHKGKIPAKPAFGKNHSTTCQWCDFSSVCLRYEDSPKRYIESLKHSECLGKLSGGEEDGEKLD
ncbi:MAG: PD-(D/E)XK nuclease family protein [Clostridia bacterium]|nr:PD-(D/E)XK nuclease family protein [Clostridia bacterium]